MASASGCVAAGHPLSAQAGATVLREGGNAVDAVLAALLTSFVAEPLLTGLGAGGYLLVAGGGRAPALLDFFVAAPRGSPQVALTAVEVSFGATSQTFHVGPASCGIYGVPAGVAAAAKEWGTVPLRELCERAARLAEKGVALNASQAYVVAILGDLLRATPEAAALWAPAGRLLGEGERFRSDDLANTLRTLGSQGAEPFYRGPLARTVADHNRAAGGALTVEDLASYTALKRTPLALPYRGRTVLTNPPPAAGGLLLAYSLALLARTAPPPTVCQLVAVLEATEAQRDHRFLAGLHEEGFAQRFLGRLPGLTTHVSAIDQEGLCAAMTTTNGEGSAVVVPGTGIHLNNVMGEADLSPEGFLSHPPLARLPSMMAPTVVLEEGAAVLALGSAGSNRIRSAILQTLVNVIDRGMDVESAVRAPRLHVEEGVLYLEPGLSAAGLPHRLVRFERQNLYFGGVQAVGQRAGRVEGAGDPRRGGAAAFAHRLRA